MQLEKLWLPKTLLAMICILLLNSADGRILGEDTVPRGYALVVGISDYPNLGADKQLDYAEIDAKDIYSILISPTGGNFKAENVHQLYGTMATRESLRIQLEEWLPSVARPNDRVLIYFAGHGFVKNGKSFLAPSDVDTLNFESTAYSMAALADVFERKISAKWKVLLTDACHSGAIFSQSDFETFNKSLLDLGSSTFSLTASRDTEVSLEGQRWGGGHGLFTYYVKMAMQGEADDNHNGIVTAAELAAYVRTNVQEDSNRHQNPTFQPVNFDPDMVLAYNPNGHDEPSAQPGTLTFETAEVDKVEVYLDEKLVGTVTKDKPLSLPPMPPGKKIVTGKKAGYLPDGPKEEMLYPGLSLTVTFTFPYPQRQR